MSHVVQFFCFAISKLISENHGKKKKRCFR